MQNVKTHKKQTVHVDRLVPCRSRLHDEAEETVVSPPTPRVAAPADLRDCRTMISHNLIHPATF